MRIKCFIGTAAVAALLMSAGCSSPNGLAWSSGLPAASSAPSTSSVSMPPDPNAVPWEDPQSFPDGVTIVASTPVDCAPSTGALPLHIKRATQVEFIIVNMGTKPVNISQMTLGINAYANGTPVDIVSDAGHECDNTGMLHDRVPGHGGGNFAIAFSVPVNPVTLSIVLLEDVNSRTVTTFQGQA